MAWQAIGPAPLPARVRDRIKSEQDAAEILIGLTQVAAVVTFCVLYAINRLTNPPPPMMIEPIPVVLGVYAVLTGVRLSLAWRRHLPRALLAASVVIDIAVLMALIWTFQLGYMGPATIYLKSSTLMYVFILIALRALRLEASYVLLAGGTAAAFWAGLLAYALVASGSRLRFTHSFADYATSASVLVGAEFDKFVSILMVSAILALVVTRGRRLLVETARGQAALSDFSHLVAPEVATRLRSGETEVMAGMAERRPVAILTTDLRGFTALAQDLTPDAMLRLLAGYQGAVVPAIESNDGSIDKYLGDGILASFGAVTANATCAADALRAVEDILDTVADWSARMAAAGMPPVRVGIAVASGEALFGTTGHMTRLEYTVIGEPVNLAAKLEKHTKEERVPALATARAFGLALAQGYAPRKPMERRPHRPVAGIEAPVDLVAFQD